MERHSKPFLARAIWRHRCSAMKIGSYANSSLGVALWRDVRKLSWERSGVEKVVLKNSKQSWRSLARFSCTSQTTSNDRFLFLRSVFLSVVSASIYFCIYCATRGVEKIFFYLASPAWVNCGESEKRFGEKEVIFTWRVPAELIQPLITRSHVSVNEFSCQSIFLYSRERHRIDSTRLRVEIKKSFFKCWWKIIYTH